MKLFKYGCGCIGFDESTIIKSCDESPFELYRPLHISVRKESRIMERNLPGVELGAEETAEIVGELSKLIVDGYKFREVKELLNG